MIIEPRRDKTYLWRSEEHNRPAQLWRQTEGIKLLFVQWNLFYLHVLFKQRKKRRRLDCIDMSRSARKPTFWMTIHWDFTQIFLFWSFCRYAQKCSTPLLWICVCTHMENVWSFCVCAHICLFWSFCRRWQNGVSATVRRYSEYGWNITCAKLICVFVFAYAKRWFSQCAAHM